MKRIYTLLLLIWICTVGYSQPKALINDPQLQFEITEAMNLLYDFKFPEADSAFRVFRDRYKNHPLPYFLLGYSQYWRTQPNEDITDFDPKFYAYMDTVIDLSEKIYSKDKKNFEAIFFLTAAHAFNGRRQSDNKEWRRATVSGSKALNYLELSREFNELSPEFLLGEGLFNYFAEWIPENYKAFKPVMWFFPKGNKQKGIQFLKQCAENAFYTRTEAQHYLIKIYLYEEKKDSEALPIAQYLHQLYPNNPVFHRLYARTLFALGRYTECQTVSEGILTQIQNGRYGYEAISGRYASFFLGWINRYKNRELAKTYFETSIVYAEKVNAVKMNYYLLSLDSLAQMAEEDKETDKAIIYYEKIKKYADKNGDLYKKAQQKVKQLKK